MLTNNNELRTMGNPDPEPWEKDYEENTPPPPTRMDIVIGIVLFVLFFLIIWLSGLLLHALDIYIAS